MEQIKEYEGKYEIHLNGPHGQPCVWSNIKNRYLKPSLHRSRGGKMYKYNKLGRDGPNVSISRLVAEYFIENENNYSEVDHINLDTLDNRISNLRWANRQMNSRNRKIKGYWYSKKEKKYQTQIKVGNGRIHYGGFKTKEEAKNKYREACVKYFNYEPKFISDSEQ